MKIMHISSRNKTIIFITFVVSLVAAITSVSLLHLTQQQTVIPSISKELKDYVTKQPDKELYNILLLGYGGPGHQGGGLSDANIVVSINLTDKRVSLIAIPRDLWVSVPVRSDKKENHKINAAFAIGRDDNGYPLKETIYKGENGPENMVKKVFGDTLGLKIDHYISIDFQRFEKLIDDLGGITVNVATGFTDSFFPIKGGENLLCDFSPEKMQEVHAKYSGFELEKQFTCRYETLEFKQGEQNMDGATALKYIRSRHSDTQGNDFSRGQRTQAVLIAIQQKLISLDAIKNIDKFYANLTKLVSTDIERSDILEFLSKAEDITDYKVNRINITTSNFLIESTSSDGQSILIPKLGVNNFSEIQNYLRENI